MRWSNGQNGEEKCLLVVACLLLLACCLLVACLLLNLRGEGCSNIYIYIFLCLRRGRYCPEAVCAAQYVLRVLLQNAQHAQHVQNANNTRITRRTRRTRSTEF